jgi:hypothetical protein
MGDVAIQPSFVERERTRRAKRSSPIQPGFAQKPLKHIQFAAYHAPLETGLLALTLLWE